MGSDPADPVPAQGHWKRKMNKTQSPPQGASRLGRGQIGSEQRQELPGPGTDHTQMPGPGPQPEEQTGEMAGAHEQRSSCKLPKGRTGAECGWRTGSSCQSWEGSRWDRPVCRSSKDITPRTQRGPGRARWS